MANSKKKSSVWRNIVLCVALITFLVIVSGAFYLHFISSQKVVALPKAESYKPKVFIRLGTSQQDKRSQIIKLIEQSIGPIEQTTENNMADIIITSEKEDNTRLIWQDSVLSLVKNLDGVILSSSQTPMLYLSYHGKFSDQDAQPLAKTLFEGLKSNLDERKLSLSAVGDIIIGRTVYQIAASKNDYTAPFAKVANKLKSADLTLANLESTLADGINYQTGQDTMSFSAPARAIDGLTFAGIDAVSLANNHSYNGGSAAFGRMMESLNKSGIKYFGAGANKTSARQPAVIERNGYKIALLAYSSIVGSVAATDTQNGQATLSLSPWGKYSQPEIDQMQAEIRLAKSQADLVFIYYHWGTEYTHQTNDDQRKAAHAAVDAGADLIIGSHPHWVAGIELYKQKLILYSLGNFIFDQEWSLKTKQGLMLQAEFKGNSISSARLLPVQIENYFQPRFLEGGSAQTILRDVYQNSF